MEVSVISLITALAVAFALGAAFGLSMGRRRAAEAVSNSSFATDKTDVESEKFKIDTMMSSFHDLTSEVGTQVDQHSSRVTEITDSLDTSGGSQPQGVLAAGTMLVQANQNLQTALCEAKAEIERQREELQQSLREARTDALTGLPNRRAFDQEILRSIASRRRQKVSFSLMMLDIDHFKHVNDRHGHMVGDQVLKAFARRLSETFRDTDFVARIGGEEFAAILPRTPLHEALSIAERTRAEIARCHYSGGEIELQVTASVGLKEAGPEETDSELFKLVDAALYQAKRTGRNCCCYHDGQGIKRGGAEAIMSSVLPAEFDLSTSNSARIAISQGLESNPASTQNISRELSSAATR